MLFHAYGPFDAPASFSAGSAQMRDFWASVEHQAQRYEWSGIDRAIGCYMFAIRKRGGYRPIYVGKTNARTGFRGEIAQPHKLRHYSKALAEGGKGVIFLFPLVTPKEMRLAKASPRQAKLIEWLERMLMGLAWAQNPDLANSHGMKFLKNCFVEGVLGYQGRGRWYKPAIEARKALKGH